MKAKHEINTDDAAAGAAASTAASRANTVKTFLFFFFARVHDIVHVIAASRVWQPPRRQQKSNQTQSGGDPIEVCA